jgi:hypothetical protein
MMILKLTGDIMLRMILAKSERRPSGPQRYIHELHITWHLATGRLQIVMVQTKTRMFYPLPDY